MSNDINVLRSLIVSQGWCKIEEEDEMVVFFDNLPSNYNDLTFSLSQMYLE